MIMMIGKMKREPLYAGQQEVLLGMVKGHVETHQWLMVVMMIKTKGIHSLSLNQVVHWELILTILFSGILAWLQL